MNNDSCIIIFNRASEGKGKRKKTSRRITDCPQSEYKRETNLFLRLPGIPRISRLAAGKPDDGRTFTHKLSCSRGEHGRYFNSVAGNKHAELAGLPDQSDERV